MSELKNWISQLEGYESRWSHRGNGVFSLGGQSNEVLPAGVYKISLSNNGELLFCSVNVISDNLISLPNSNTESLIKSIEKFWSKKDDYTKFGQIHKRGILLHSTPGQGKSSTLDLVFNQLLLMNGLVFIVDDPELIIEAIERLRLLEKDRKLILLYEDIDSLFEKWGEKNLLSMLDGQLQTDNVLHMATTNYIDRIPDRLKNRPGRFDEVIEVFPPDTDQRKAFIEHLMTNVEDKSMILDIVKDTAGFSLAQVKELILSTYLLDKNYMESVNRITLMGKGK